VVRWRVLLAVIAGIAPVALAGALAASGREAAPSSARAAKGAVKLVTARGGPLKGRWQGWADRALVPTVAGRVTVRLLRCPARPTAAGCVYTKRPRTVFLRPGLRDPRGVLLHELGHVFDLKVMNNRDRGAFRKIMGRGRSKWWRGAEPLAEQFAEAYSWCARYARIVSISRYSSYDYRPTGKQHRRICRLVRSAAVDRRAAKRPADVPVVTRPHPPPPPPPSSAPGVVPGDPQRDPGARPTPTPTPKPTATPNPVPVPLPTPSGTAPPLPTPPPLPLGGGR
jgi:hypothetical protein